MMVIVRQEGSYTWTLCYKPESELRYDHTISVV